MKTNTLLLSLSLFFTLPVSQAVAQDISEANEEQKQGKLIVSASKKLSATVYVDNKEVGTTPLKLRLPAGPHQVRVAADGYNPFVRRVQISENSNNVLKAELTQGNGTIEFQSSAAGAEVLFQGKSHILPMRLATIPNGVYAWVITAPSHEPQKGTLSFSKGKNLFVFAPLESSLGLVEITSAPSEAQAFLNGNYVGDTPVHLEGVDPEMHNVMLKKKGYGTLFRDMDTSQGNKGTIAASMNKSSARLTIRTGEKDARVFVENTEIGEGRVLRLGKVNKGIYNVSVRHPDYKNLQSHISLPGTGFYKYKAILENENSEQGSVLNLQPPLIRRWYFWAGIGATVVAGGTTTVIISKANTPVPAPDGDATLTLP